MRISRRDFLKAAAAAAAAGRITPAALADLRKVLLSRDLPRVIWLHGQGCDGCTISLLNSIHYAGIADVLTGTISLEFHNTVMAAAGDLILDSCRRAMQEHALSPARERVKIVPAQLGADAGVIGAAGLALTRVEAAEAEREARTEPRQRDASAETRT